MEQRPLYSTPEHLTVSLLPRSPASTFRDNRRELFSHLIFELSTCDSKQNKNKIPAPLLRKDDTLFSVFACACLPSDVHAEYVELSEAEGACQDAGFSNNS